MYGATFFDGDLRYVRISIGSEELAALPEAVERRDDGAGYHNFENLLHEVLVEARTRWQLTEIFERPRHLPDVYFNAERLLDHAEVREQRLIVQYRRVFVLYRLYQQLIVGGRVHVAQRLLCVGELLLETSTDLQPKLVDVCVDDDGLEADTKRAQHEDGHEDDDAGMLVDTPAELEEM